MLYVVGFIVTFVIGGLTGVMVAAVPLDLQLHDTYFIVAHFHYVLIGGAVFPLLGILTYWFPKITGRMMSETLGKIGFWMIFLGFQLTFFPMHWSGPAGHAAAGLHLSRRAWASSFPTCSRRSARSWSRAAVAAVRHQRHRLALPRRDRRRPIRGARRRLEWATSSPPPVYNFAHIPVVESRTPLWDSEGELPVVTGLRVDEKEMLLTTVVAATPDLREPVPEPSLWPFIAAIAVGIVFVASIFSPWALAVGVDPVRHRR